MKDITAKQLGYLLGISTSDAIGKIMYARDKYKIKTPPDENEKNPAIDIDKMSKHLDIDLMFYIGDIKFNYMKRSATRGFIMNYPDSKLKPNKDGKIPRSVSIPPILKSFLSDLVAKEIVEAWKEKYVFWIKEHEVKFK
jgi:hypothetical protein